MALTKEKLDKHELNVDRYDKFLNGADDEDTPTEGGTIPTLAKALKQFGEGYEAIALAAQTNYDGNWSAGSYLQGRLVTHNGGIWLSTTGTSQEPGEGTDWQNIKLIGGDASAAYTQILSLVQTATTAARLANGVVRTTKAKLAAAVSVGDIGQLGIAEIDETNGDVATAYEVISDGSGGAELDEGSRFAVNVADRIVMKIGGLASQRSLTTRLAEEPTTGDYTLQDFESVFTDGGYIRIPKAEISISSTVAKGPATVWEGIYGNSAGGDLSSKLVNAQSATMIEVQGAGSNRGGEIAGLRLENDSEQYPEAIAIVCVSDLVDHYFSRLRIAGFQYGHRQIGGAAVHWRDGYVINALADGIYLENVSDSKIDKTQTTGNERGLHLVACTAVEIIGSRPQVSGLANARVIGSVRVQFIGGDNDSGSGIGLELIDSTAAHVIGTEFFQNGEGWPHVLIASSPGDFCQQIQIHAPFRKGSRTTQPAIAFGAVITLSGVSGTFERGETVTGSTSGQTAKVVDYDAGNTQLTVVATTADARPLDAAETITGGTSGASATTIAVGGTIKNITITNCDFSEVSASVVGGSYVSDSLIIENNQGLAEYAAYNNQSADIQLNPVSPLVLRFVGSSSGTFNLYLPFRGVQTGKRFTVITEAGFSGTIHVRTFSGTLVRTIRGVGKAVAFVCTSAINSTYAVEGDTLTTMTSDVGDASITATRATFGVYRYFSPITDDRLVTGFSAPSPGDTIRVARYPNATGASSVISPSGQALAVGEWVDDTWNGAAWSRSAKGTL